MVDPITIGGGAVVLYLLLKGKSTPKPSPLQAPDIQEIVRETSPAVLETVVARSVEKVVTEKPELIPSAPAISPAPPIAPAPAVVPAPVAYPTPVPTPPSPGQIAVEFIPDPSRAGLLFLQKKYPQLGLKYIHMGKGQYQIIVSTVNVQEALSLLPQDPTVVSVARYA